METETEVVNHFVVYTVGPFAANEASISKDVSLTSLLLWTEM